MIGERGRVPLLDVFDGRRQLVVYYHMWQDGKPAKDQCEGCTFCNGQVSELSYLHARDVTCSQFRTNGRPSAQWSRLAAGRPDDLNA